MKYINQAAAIPRVSRLLIFGAGGRGRAFAEMVRLERPDIVLAGFLDTYKSGTCQGLPILRLADYRPSQGDHVVVCSTYAREIVGQLAARGSTGFQVYLDEPPQVRAVLDITTRCNSRCVFCANIHNPDRLRGPDWDMDTFERAYAHVAEVDEVCFCCAAGEPLLNRDLPAMLRACKERGKATSFYTNGAALYPGPGLEAVARHSDKIYISFVSPRTEVQDRYMRGIRAEAVQANLSAMATVPDRPFLLMNVLVMRENLGHLAEIARFALDSGVSQVVFTRMRREGRPELADVVLRGLSPLEREAGRRELDRARELGGAGGLEVLAHSSLLAELEEPCAAGGPDGPETPSAACPQGGPRTRLCALPWTTRTVYFDGTATPCCLSAQRLGNAFTDPGPLFEGPRHTALQQGLLRGRLNGPCATCDIYPLGSPAVLAELLAEQGIFLPGADAPETAEPQPR
jgi:MoaA/NifB/PqqE/SkfB family radical SAM enzyme